MSHKPLTHSSSTRVNSDGLIRQIVSFSFCLFISQFEGFTETFEDIILVVQLRKKKKNLHIPITLPSVIFWEPFNCFISNFSQMFCFSLTRKNFSQDLPPPLYWEPFSGITGLILGYDPLFLENCSILTYEVVNSCFLYYSDN